MSLATPRQLWALNRAGKLALLREGRDAQVGKIKQTVADEAIRASITEAGLETFTDEDGKLRVVEQ